MKLPSFISKKITITVNGKDVAPESKEGKKILEETDKEFTKMDKSFDLMGKMFDRMGKMFDRLF